MIELGIDQQQSASLRQEQTLTQQQIQAIEMLAATALELQGYVNSELQENPLLEADTKGIEELPTVDEPASSDTGDDDAWIAEILELSETGYRNSGSVQTSSPEEVERRNHFMNSIAVQTTLEDSLLDQIRFLEPASDLFSCCEVIVAALDEDGYLKTHPADLAMALGMPLDLISKAIQTVQSCDPAGVAATDLRERLLIQLDRLPEEHPLARKLIDCHLDDLGANRIPTLARKLGVDFEDIRDALEVIRELQPHITEAELPVAEVEVEPEVDIEERDGEFQVLLRDGRIPSLHINAQYRSLLSDPATTEETREYVKDKIRSAAFLINCITQRQSTLERIVRAIVNAQEDFFRQGISCLRPLTMAEVADQIGVHETTVSRGVSGKYLSCKFGVMSLRTFFSNGYNDSEGNSVSNQVVKQTVRDLISQEDRHQPLSDSQISEMLEEQGLHVARRTVAKYRENLGLLPAKLRRQYW
jgi:RNA polymerase sigma-54 factor